MVCAYSGGCGIGADGVIPSGNRLSSLAGHLSRDAPAPDTGTSRHHGGRLPEGGRMDLDLLEVRSFLTLAATGHYGPAAAQLHVSESGLSKRVARLERSLGVGLLERDSQGVACLTTAGRRFRREAEALVDQADVAVATAGGSAGANLVRLGLPGQQSTPRDRAQLHEFQVRVNDEMSRDARVVCVGIPFGATARSLLEGHADVVVDALPA